MPQTPARAIPGVRLEHDHRAHSAGLCASSPTYCWRHHRLERGLAGVRAQALDMVTQRGYSRRSVAHIAAALRGPCFEPLISDHCTDRAVLYAYPRLGVHRRRRRRGSQSRSNCCLSRTSAKTGSCRGPFHLALRKVRAGVCPMSRIGHPCGNPHQGGLFAADLSNGANGAVGSFGSYGILA
jgi:hypothetical protein